MYMQTILYGNPKLECLLDCPFLSFWHWNW